MSASWILAELVFKELDLLEPTANVYKLTGPALLKQDLGEAKTNVDSRITMLKAEMCVELVPIESHPMQGTA